MPVTVNQPGHADFNVTYLFEIEGVKIYRFTDSGYARYFAIGNGTFLPQLQSSVKTHHFDGAVNGTSYSTYTEN